MKHIIFLSIVLASFTSAASASLFDWITFRSAAGGFSVLMPGPKDPVERVSRTETSNVGPYTTHLFIQGSTSGSFLVGWTDYASGVNFNKRAEMEANRDNLVKQLKGTISSSKWFTFNGSEALEFAAVAEGRAIRARVYMVGNRPYMTIAMSNPGVDDSVNVTRFLDSFKFIGR